MERRRRDLLVNVTKHNFEVAIHICFGVHIYDATLLETDLLYFPNLDDLKGANEGKQSVFRNPNLHCFWLEYSTYRKIQRCLGLGLKLLQVIVT